MAEERYLLVKEGLYYRPNSNGYTGIKDEAGRFPASRASEADGIEAIHEDDAPDYSAACWDDVKAKHQAKRRATIIETDHPISQLANVMAGEAQSFAEQMGISKWNVAEAMANACGLILAESADLPRDKAIQRMDGLRHIMEATYDLSDVQGGRQ